MCGSFLIHQSFQGGVQQMLIASPIYKHMAIQRSALV